MDAKWYIYYFSQWLGSQSPKRERLLEKAHQYSFLFFFFSVSCRFRATPVACGGSQARSLIGPVAAGLHQSHSKARSEACLQPTPQLTALPDP